MVADARIDLDVIEMAQHMRSFIGTGPAGTSTLRMDLVQPRAGACVYECILESVHLPHLPHLP